ncbi:MAG: hypothetical protein LBL13_08330 [Bacteroidales bacterium]|jgi:lysyl-tRNA synthetase class II|nr:hypothetical protein [Bacteroidales bacterium]
MIFKKAVNIGDIASIGRYAFVRELSFHINTLKLLSKALCVQSNVNPQEKKVFVKRMELINAMRENF